VGWRQGVGVMRNFGRESVCEVRKYLSFTDVQTLLIVYYI
jgi:hypothetical protein